MDKRRMSGRERLVLGLPLFIRAGLYLVLLSPLLVWSEFLYPHLTAKVIGFQVLVELVFAAFLVMVFLRKPERGGTPSPLRAPLMLALASFLFYSLFAAGFSTDPNQSLWGTVSRQDGLVLLMHFLAWTVVLVSLYSGSNDRISRAKAPRTGDGWNIHSYLQFSFWVSVIVALTAWVDTEVKVRGIVRSILAILSSPDRISGVFGNPAFLGSYLLFHFFFGLYFLLKWRKSDSDCERAGNPAAPSSLRHRIARYAKPAGTALGIAIIALTILAGQTRGVILGLIMGLLAIGAMYVFGPSSKRTIRIAVFVFTACAILGAVAIWQHRNSPLISRFPLLQRLTHFTSAENISTAARLLSWGSGLRSTLDHPLLGWGYDNAYYALNKYYDPRQIKLSPFVEASATPWFDKSHNFFIDLLIERGIIGVLLYFLLLGVVVRSLWRLADRRLAVCMAGAFVSYLICNTFAFDSFGSLFGFFLTMSWLASSVDSEPADWPWRLSNRARKASKAERRKASKIPGRPAVRILSVITLLTVALYLQAEIAVAHHMFALARASFAQDPARGVTQYVDAFGRFSPYAGREKLTCVSLIVNNVIEKRLSANSMDIDSLVARLIEEALAAHPQDAASYIVLNDMYNNLARYVNPEFAASAESFGKKALEMLPHHQSALFNLSRTYLIRNEPARAVELNRRMLTDADFADGHLYLGLSLLMNDQKDEGKKEIRRAIELGCQPSAKVIISLKRLLSDKEISELTAR